MDDGQVQFSRLKVNSTVIKFIRIFAVNRSPIDLLCHLNEINIKNVIFKKKKTSQVVHKIYFNTEAI